MQQPSPSKLSPSKPARPPLPSLTAAALGVAFLGGLGWSARVAAAPAQPMTMPMRLGSAAASRIAAVAGMRATVLIFVGTNCPISNGYAPEIAAIAKAFAPQGAAVTLVYADAGTTAEAAARHAKEYGLAGLPRLMDSDQRLADALGATVTPEAVVLGPDQTVCYRGRIDDRYIERAASARPNGPSTHDLRAAIDAVLADRPVAVAQTRVVGCAIERAVPTAPMTAAAAAQAAPNYAHGVAAILNENCVSCHRAGQIAPFSLAGYANAKSYADNIAGVTQAGTMPPWKPEGMHGAFVGERGLTPAQVRTLSDWAAAGAPAGDLAAAPPTPQYASGWSLGPPDLIVRMPEAYSIPASGPDIYRCFVLPTGLTTDKQVVAVEYHPGNPRVVHHCIGYLDNSGKGRALDAADPGPGYTSFGGPGFTPSGEIGGWAPGNMARLLPDGIAKPLWAGSDVVLQVHYHPDGKPEQDQTEVGIYFAKKPAPKRLYTYPLLARLDIPAGEADYHTGRTVHLPVDVDIVSVTPHMHLIGKTISLTATLPDGTIQPLVRINHWDFRWQDTYTFRQPVHLPKGTAVRLEATYDNSAANPRNPTSPPKWVGWGEATTDEMCIGFISFVTDQTDGPLIRLLSRGDPHRTTPETPEEQAELHAITAPIHATSQ
jgi:hypothetical protein